MKPELNAARVAYYSALAGLSAELDRIRSLVPHKVESGVLLPCSEFRDFRGCCPNAEVAVSVLHQRFDKLLAATPAETQSKMFQVGSAVNVAIACAQRVIELDRKRKRRKTAK